MIRDVSKLVKEELEQNEDCRNSDTKLIMEILKRFQISSNTPISVVLDGISSKKIPPFWSITRARRKCQELYPHLSATKKVEECRINNEQECIEFSMDKSI